MGQGDSTALPAGSKRQVTESELEQEEPPAKAVKTGKYKKSYFICKYIEDIQILGMNMPFI